MPKFKKLLKNSGFTGGLAAFAVVFAALLSIVFFVSCNNGTGGSDGDTGGITYEPAYTAMSTGGTIKYLDGSNVVQAGGPDADTAYVVHVFTANGTLSITRAPSGAAMATLVAGGGGGGGASTGYAADYGGGGGAGGVRQNVSVSLSTDIYDVVVGTGGAGGTISANPNIGTCGTNGGDTAIKLDTTILASASGGGGGGAGGGNNTGVHAESRDGQAGGSGGGGAEGGGTNAGAGGAAADGQGNAGAAAQGGDVRGGGGGGAGSAGSGISGGDGVTLTLPAGILASNDVAAGGAGANTNSANAAAANGTGYGSGGNGAKGRNGGDPGAEHGGAGASGLFVIRIPYAPEQVPVTPVN